MALKGEPEKMPTEMIDAYLLAETGWPPEQLDNAPVERVQRYLLYKRIKDIAINGGEFG